MPKKYLLSSKFIKFGNLLCNFSTLKLHSNSNIPTKNTRVFQSHSFTLNYFTKILKIFKHITRFYACYNCKRYCISNCIDEILWYFLPSMNHDLMLWYRISIFNLLILLQVCIMLLLRPESYFQIPIHSNSSLLNSITCLLF